MSDWTQQLLAIIPDKLLHAETARRRARKRQSYSGGKVWRKHNPNLTGTGCRCASCIRKREAGR